MGHCMGSYIGAEIMSGVFFPPMAFSLEHCEQISNVYRLRIKIASHHIFPKPRVRKMFVSYLVNFVPICCLSSSLSSSVCMGRMFFSSSSRLEGLLLSLIAKESFLQTFIAREPVGEERLCQRRCHHFITACSRQRSTSQGRILGSHLHSYGL